MTTRTTARRAFAERQRAAFVDALRQPLDPAARARELVDRGLSDHEAAALAELSPADVRRELAERRHR